MIIWSDAAFPKYKSEWFVLDSAASAKSFANYVRIFHQHTGRKFGIGGGGTGIGAGIAASIEMMETNSFDGLRRVVDVSGDGIETDPWFEKAITLPNARIFANAKNVQVNGLPILNQDFPYLDKYYRSEVITGPGSFIEIANGFDDFGRAIMAKLARELSTPIALREPIGWSTKFAAAN